MGNIYVWMFNASGQIRPINESLNESMVASLDEVTSTFPIGAYTTFRTFKNHYAFHFEEHFRRLENTCSLENKKLIISEKNIRFALRNVLNIMPPRDYRIRLLIPTQIPQNRGYIIAEALIPYPQKYYSEGISVVTVKMIRNKPRAKMTSIIQETAYLKEKSLLKCQEIILMDANGNLLEGISSNFFGVINGVLFTAGSGILEGITRQTILNVMKENHIPYQLRTVNISSLSLMQEAFISSSSRGIFPVVKINDAVIGNGSPGEITQRISELYNQKLNSELIPI